VINQPGGRIFFFFGLGKMIFLCVLIGATQVYKYEVPCHCEQARASRWHLLLPAGAVEVPHCVFDFHLRGATSLRLSRNVDSSYMYSWIGPRTYLFASQRLGSQSAKSQLIQPDIYFAAGTNSSRIRLAHFTVHCDPPSHLLAQNLLADSLTMARHGKKVLRSYLACALHPHVAKCF